VGRWPTRRRRAAVAWAAAGALAAAVAVRAGSVRVSCAPSVAVVAAAGQSVCFGTDPAAGLSAVPAAEQPSGDTTLLFSDDPEYVPGPGILAQGEVGPGPFRLYLYHADPSGAGRPVYLAVVLANRGHVPVQVQVRRWAVGGPSSDYLAVGKAATAAWLGGAGPTFREAIPPGASVFLDAPLPAGQALEDRPLEPGQALNAIVDGVSSGPLGWTVAAEAAPVTSPADVASLPVLPSDRRRPGQRPMRGTFAQADERGAYTLAPSGSGTFIVHVADAGRYLWGYSALDGRSVVDYGNYGVLYTEALTILAPADGPFALALEPRGGNFASAATVVPPSLAAGPGPLPLPSDNAFLPPHAYATVFGVYCPTGNPVRVTVRWMPAAGSYLPIDLLVLPLPAAAPAAQACAAAARGRAARTPRAAADPPARAVRGRGGFPSAPLDFRRPHPYNTRDPPSSARGRFPWPTA
jgi:hypothetical protein